MRPITFPRARLGLATILMARRPELEPARAVKNADDIIAALHSMGLQVGPIAAFGPHDDTSTRDPLASFVETMLSYEETQPWLPR